MCIRDRTLLVHDLVDVEDVLGAADERQRDHVHPHAQGPAPVSYTHLRAHETVLDLVCRLLLETKKRQIDKTDNSSVVHYHVQHDISYEHNTN